MTHEVERKFVLSAPPPDLSAYRSVEVSQGYLLVGSTEMRIRRKGRRFFLTVKGGGGLSRREWETEIPEDIFEALWPSTESRRIEKTRYSLLLGDVTLEIDEYVGSLRGLWTMEAEFTSEAAARAFVVPAWAADAVEVTEHPRYRNQALAITGLPGPIAKPNNGD